MSPSSILEIIEYHEDCPYSEFSEFLADAQNLFNETQKLKIDCMKNIAITLSQEKKELS